MTVILENSWQKSCKMTVIEGKLSAAGLLTSLLLACTCLTMSVWLRHRSTAPGCITVHQLRQSRCMLLRLVTRLLISLIRTSTCSTQSSTRRTSPQNTCLVITHRGGDQSQWFIMHKFIKVKTFHANFTNLTTRSELFIEIGYKVQLYIIEKEIMLLLR